MQNAASNMTLFIAICRRIKVLQSSILFISSAKVGLKYKYWFMSLKSDSLRLEDLIYLNFCTTIIHSLRA